VPCCGPWGVAEYPDGCRDGDGDDGDGSRATGGSLYAAAAAELEPCPQRVVYYRPHRRPADQGAVQQPAQ
jgi:hypothetical protein